MDSTKAWEVRQAHFPPVIEFDYPGRTIPVSVTGTDCALSCAHCNGHFLHSMTPIEQAELRQEGSFLISGGCDHSGKVPVNEHLDAIGRLRDGRRLNWHVGLLSEDEVRQVAPLADVISFDFVVDQATITEVYGLERTPQDYIETYMLLKEHAASVYPHITIGLKGGVLRGEYQALAKLVELGLDGLTLIVFTPMPGTAYADCQPPPLAEVERFLVAARLAFPDRPICLGCLRPHGRYRGELDRIAVACGVNKIVKPAPSGEQEARARGLRVIYSEECCALERDEMSGEAYAERRRRGGWRAKVS